MRHAKLITIAILGSALASGCHNMDTPANFVSVDRSDLGDYKIKTISADGVVVGLKTRPNPKNGTLEFWSEAISNELIGRGYKLIKSEDVTNSAGTPGKLMEFQTFDRGTTFGYLLAVYVTDMDVLLAEAGGKDQSLKKRSEAIRKSILSAR